MITAKCVEVKYDDVGRVYVYDDGAEYYSVTTMLSATGDNTGLVRWRKRVGDKEADEISALASHLGEEYHLLGEHYLLDTKAPDVNEVSTTVFETTKPILDKHITKIHSVEEALRTDVYKLAGRSDAVVDWDDELAIFDFKLLKHHDRRWLSSYWLQTAIYAQCWYEMYGVKPKKLVLVVGNKENVSTQYFVANTRVHEKKVRYRISQFHSKY